MSLLFLSGALASCGGSEEEPYSVSYRSTNDAGTTCGDGVIQYPEVCDGNDFGGGTCASLTLNSVPNGKLRCSSKCTLDVRGCFGSSMSGMGGAGGGAGGSGLPGAGGSFGQPGAGGSTTGAGGGG